MSSPSPSRRTVHVPVMLREVIKQLDLSSGQTVLDGTVGAGGHSQKILEAIGETGQLVGLDRDETMLKRAAEVLHEENVSLRQASYVEAAEVLKELDIPQVDRVLLDLGLSSDQLADADRGFGFDTSGSLDMRFDVQSGKSVRKFLERADVSEIENAIREFGEEKQAAKIASEIVRSRQSGAPVERVSQLVELILKATSAPAGNHRTSSVTRVFQALRIAVNAELEHLDRFLVEVLPKILKTGGRVVIITFHSLEDRRVKEAFRDKSCWKNLTPKPLLPTASEVRRNPRARSAKLRVAERT